MKSIIPIFALALLTSCSAEQDSEPPFAATSDTGEALQQTAGANSNPDEYFDTDTSVLALMNAIIQPSALELWQAVRYVVTAEGVEEEIRPFCLSLEWRLNRYQQSLYVCILKDKNTCLPKIKAIHQLFDIRIRVHVHYSKQRYRESNQCKYERHL